jgi:HEAT repeat protein
MLDDKNARANAAAALGVLRDARAVDPLLALLSGKDQQGRYWAVFALGLIKDPRAVDPLAAVLRDEDAHGNVAVATLLHTNAVEALGEIKDKRAVPPLSSYLGTGKYPKARIAAAEALGKIGDASGIPALVTVIGNDTAFGVDDVELAREIHQNAVQALGAIKDPQAVDPLLQYVKARDRDGRSAGWTLFPEAPSRLDRPAWCGRGRR